MRNDAAVRSDFQNDVVALDAALVLDAAPEAFLAMDEDGRIIAWNRAAETLFGWTREEALGQELAALIVPDRLRGDHRADLARHVSTGRGFELGCTLELRALHRDGHELDIEATIGETHEERRIFHAFLHDISERAERDRQLTAQLRVMDVHATADERDALLRAIEALCREGGWRFGAVWLAGDDVDLLHGYTPWWDPMDSELETFATSSRGSGFCRGLGLPGIAWETEEPVWGWPLDGNMVIPRYVLARNAGLTAALAVPLRSGSEVVAVVELFAGRTDEPEETTPWQRALVLAIAPQMAEFVARRRAERSAAADKDAFVATVSHELRTPLTSIIGYARTSLDMDATLTGEQRRNFLEIILQQGERLSRLVDDLLTMSAMQVRGIAPDLQEVELVSLAAETLSELGRETQFELRTDGRLHVVWADRDLCKQLIVNLVQNALRYGDPTYAVEIHDSDVAWAARVEVVDEGPGVPPAFVPRLFDKFARASETSRVPGTGLGLAIVRAIADAQRGRAWYEANEPKGARFIVELPRPQALRRV
jgi:PAS domain S-box-containing protein